MQDNEAETPIDHSPGSIGTHERLLAFYLNIMQEVSIMAGAGAGKDFTYQ